MTPAVRAQQLSSSSSGTGTLAQPQARLRETGRRDRHYGTTENQSTHCTGREPLCRRGVTQSRMLQCQCFLSGAFDACTTSKHDEKIVLDTIVKVIAFFKFSLTACAMSAATSWAGEMPLASWLFVRRPADAEELCVAANT